MPHVSTIKEKLDHMNEIPGGVSFNAATTWQRLEDRLHRSPRRKYGWLKIAAVLVLTSSAIAVYYSRDNVNRPDISVTAPAPTPAPGAIHAQTQDASKKRHTIAPTTVVKYKQHSTVKTTGTSLQQAIEQPEDKIMMPPTLIGETVITPAPVIITASTPVKKKLRIVHLNDLYRPDIVEIAKAETKQQQQPDPQPEPEPSSVLPPKPFWKTKASARITTSLNDNP